MLDELRELKVSETDIIDALRRADHKIPADSFLELPPQLIVRQKQNRLGQRVCSYTVRWRVMSNLGENHG